MICGLVVLAVTVLTVVATIGICLKWFGPVK